MNELSQLPDEAQTLTQDSGRSGVSANMLKTIAITAMAIDHVAASFVTPDTALYIIMRFIGRITGPVMFFLVAQGYHHTRNVNRYTVRLGLFALISYVPFIYCFNGTLPNADNFLNLNVIYTIFIGLLAIRVRHEIGNPVIKILVLGVLCALSSFGDWGYIGFFMMLAFDYFYGDFKNQAVSYCFIVLSLCGILTVLLSPLWTWQYDRVWDFSYITMYASEYGMFVPIIILSFYKGAKGKGGSLAKWGFYIFYPAHLLIIGLIKHNLLG